MKVIRLSKKFIQLPGDRKLIVLETLFWMGVIRIGLRVTSFRTIKRIIAFFTDVPKERKDINDESVSKVIWAVNVAAQCFPGFACLTNAMVVTLMLANRGFNAQIRIGITQKENGEIMGHAWVERNGKVILGGTDSPSRFIQISSNEKLMNKLSASIK